MGNSSPHERRALEALEDVAAAGKTAKKAAKTVGPKRAKTLRELAAEAKDVAATPIREARKHPKRVAKVASATAVKVVEATTKVLRAQAEKDSRKSAKHAPIEPPVVDPVIDEAPDIEVPSTATAPPAASAEHPDLTSMTVAALRDRARAEGRTGYSRMTKAELLELLA